MFEGRKGHARSRPASVSAFDVVIDRTLTLRQDGKARAVTVEEALWQRTYQDAVSGNRAAMRAVLKMIARREAWLAAHAPKRPRITVVKEPADPRNADGALLLLDVAEPDPGWDAHDSDQRLLLRPWAVATALARFGPGRLWAEDTSEIGLQTAGGADAVPELRCEHGQDV